MSYDLRPLRSDITEDRVEWFCPCGFQLGAAFTRFDERQIGYEVGGYVSPVTGGVGAGCPACGQRFYLPSGSDQPSVIQVTACD